MSKPQSHISLDYLHTELEINQPCSREKCTGTMIEVLVQYEPFGPINHEAECCICGKVRKDKYYAALRKQAYEEKLKKKANQNAQRRNGNKWHEERKKSVRRNQNHAK